MAKISMGFLRKYIVLLVVAVMISGLVNGANPVSRDSLLNLPLFKNDFLLKIELKTNLAVLINDVADNRSYHQSTIKVKNPDGKIDILNADIKTRGNFRRRKQNCDFPPLRFKLSPENTVNTEFQGQSKLKYVSHCQSSVDGYDQHTIEEYLIYKMYNQITDYSYRARLAQVSFINTNTFDTITRFGFFLEDKDDVALRIGKKTLNYKNIKQYEVLRDNMVMLSLFQLMIGNADWDVGRLHNIDVMAVSENSIPIVVPFDFDWSGMVNHSYFTLSPNIEPNAKYKRIYKGMRWNPDELEKAFSNFRELKAVFYELINQCEYLEADNRGKLIGYIEKFYELINSKKDVRDVIQKKAKKIPKGS